MRTSIIDLFRIGIGPSSSHTVGPARAALGFGRALSERGLLNRVDAVEIHLYGSLALTGKGHATDRAVMLGLSGHDPQHLHPHVAETQVNKIREQKRLRLSGQHEIEFDEPKHLVFHNDEVLPEHSNGMRFRALDDEGAELLSEIVYSIGGGAIRKAGEHSEQGRPAVPYPFTSGAELLERANERGWAIWRLMLEDEQAWHSEEEVLRHIDRVWDTMQQCAQRGLATEGTLPGGLNVKRRAPAFARRLQGASTADPLNAMDWLNVYAMAVNEENAAGGRVVTAPTNGAAGVIPSVANYFVRFHDGDREGLHRFFLAAAAIGVLYKENASISGAEVGCQGEVGVACSMAAAGLASALNASNEQVEHAAEIAMEHNLGMTCDPVAGLVQVPCIERNAIGAVKAVNATRLAMADTGTHVVHLDDVIRTMYETGLDMSTAYKETAQAGLALHVIKC
jgi:L-serine dehydratase